MVLYPKIATSDTVRGLQGGMNSSTNAIVPALHTFQNNSGLQVAPSRYSNVRKVVFSLSTGKFGNGTTSTCKLGVAIGSTTTPLLTVQQFSLPNTTLIEGASDYGLTPTNRINAATRGPTTTIVQKTITANERDHAQILQVEFDREDGGTSDFFDAWDAFSNDDNYMFIQPIVESLTADTGAVIAYNFKAFQCTIIQEQDSPNNTSTDWHSFIGCNDALEATTTYQGATFGARMPFKYVADDWDGLTNVSAIFYGNEPSNATQITLQIYDITSDAIVFEEVFSLPSGGVSYYILRSKDFLGDLVDGREYRLDYKLDLANSTGDPRGTGYFTLIQKSFTRTTTFHQIAGLSLIPTVTSTCDGASMLFDPAWYTVAPADIKVADFVSAFIHNVEANTPDCVVRLDTNLLSDDSTRGSGTAKDLTPNHAFTGAPTGPKSLYTPILTNDPMDESVQVRLQKSYVGGTWTGGIDDFPGHIGVYYSYVVGDESATLSQFGGRDDPGLDLTDIGPI